MNEIMQWLLSSEPYVRYRTRLDLLDQSLDDPEVQQAKVDMLAYPLVQGLLSELVEWPGDAINNHKKANLLIHKLAFLAELGVSQEDSGMEAIIQKVMAHITEQGVAELLINLPKAFGGSGENIWAWTLCDTPRLYFSLAKMGVNEATLHKGINTLEALMMDNGWPCAASPKLGRFRGPGRKTDPCPYATLIMLSALLQTKIQNRSELYTGAECLLNLWQNSHELHPFLFHMGTDFRKLKAPFVWYDILHVADVLSQLPWLCSDPRMKDILLAIQTKADENGAYTPESVWVAWKDWDFGQKKNPSPWLTFLVLRILKRFGETVSS